MPSIHIDFAVAAGIVVLIVVLATAAAVFFYRHTLPPVARSRRILLTVLRSLVLSLLAVLLCEPLIRLTFSSTHPPVIALLIDDSKSMTIKDRRGSRDSTLHALVSHPVFSRLGERAEVRVFTFGTKFRPANVPVQDTLSLSEDATDISGALQGLQSESQRARVDAAVILTDGSYTLGENPLHRAEQLGIPLYTVGIGDSSVQSATGDELRAGADHPAHAANVHHHSRRASFACVRPAGARGGERRTGPDRHNLSRAGRTTHAGRAPWRRCGDRARRRAADQFLQAGGRSAVRLGGRNLGRLEPGAGDDRHGQRRHPWRGGRSWPRAAT